MTPTSPSPAAAARIALAVLAFAASACSRAVQVGSPSPDAAAAPSITSGVDVVRAMHDRYAGKWYRNVTFAQKTTIFTPSGGQLVQSWVESGQFPGKLRIDVLSAGSPVGRDGFLFANDSVYRFSSGKLVSADTGHNELLTLGFDVYAEPVATSEALLRKEGFDLAKLSDGTWEGKPVWIVGAAAGDSTHKQFWIEKDRLLFVRMLEPRGTALVDVRFGNYVAFGGAWVAEQVDQLVNGKPRIREEYSDVKVNVTLDPALFDPAHWGTATHWYKPASQ